MKRNKLLLLLVLLVAVATGAWAQSTIHVVKQDNVNTIFSGNGYTLGDAVKAGDVLDFQSTIDIEHSLVINKQVTIKSTTTDAVIKLHTVAGSLMGDDPGNCFVINKAGSGTTVQDIRLENTEMWIFNTSNVTFTGVTMWVEDARVGTGVGHVALRYSDHVTFDGCTVYTKNNGGSSACALTGSHDCTFKDTRFETAGSVGNVLYIANSFNFQDKPADYTMNNDNISVINCTFTAESSGGLSNFQIVGGLRHRIENCTVNYKTSFGCTATASEDGIVIRNNTFTQGLSIPRASTVTGNTINGNVTISANNATVSGTTFFPGSTITGNSILGKVEFRPYSKNNTFTGNTVISTEAYAVVMATTADANNTVTDNILLAASNAGDAAVNPSTGTGNTITGNLSEAATGEVTWNFDATTGTLTIGGTGAMADYDQTTAPWAFLSDKITRVVIGEGVTKVGSNAFQGCTALNDVFVNGAKTLTIGTAAFDATKTPAIYVPTGQEAAYQTAWSAYAGSIGEYMNCGADAMAVYDAATKTLTICGKGAMTDFASAADQPWKSLQGQLQTVCFEPFITAIGANAFSGCSALTAAKIEGTATTIADGAFDGNATGRRIFVPAQTIAGYGESAYLADIYSVGQCGAEGSDVSWELSAKTMALSISGTGAMADYANANSVPWSSVRDKITSATIAEGVTTVGNYAFYSCTGMATVNIPDGVTEIGSNAFYGCSNLANFNIPATVTSIGGSAFYGCSNLANVTIPDGVTTIGSSAFQNCAALTAITLPVSVTIVGSQAFRSCSKLTEINIFAVSLQTYGYNAFMNTPDGLKIYVPAISLEEYKTQWSAYADKFVALPYYALIMKEGTEDADKWTVKVGEAEKTVTLPITNLKGGEKITVTYSGMRKVMSVKAEKKVTPATVSTAPTAKTGVKVGEDKAIINAGTAGGGTMYYAVTTTNAKPANSDGFSGTVPTAKTLTAGTYYVWYYVKADDRHIDSEISATAIEVTIAKATPTFSVSPSSVSFASTDNVNATKQVTITYNGDGVLSVSSSNTNMVTASVNNKTITLTRKSVDGGSVTITVSAAAGTNYAQGTNQTITVTLTSADSGTYLQNAVAGDKVGSNGKVYKPNATMPAGVTVVGCVVRPGVVFKASDEPGHLTASQLYNYKVSAGKFHYHSMNDLWDRSWEIYSIYLYNQILLDKDNTGQSQATATAALNQVNSYLQAAGCDPINVNRYYGTSDGWFYMPNSLDYQNDSDWWHNNMKYTISARPIFTYDTK